ncbi:ABC transporter ATP-binding protein [Ruminococcus gauvreauii]|uniref:ABC transporter ATP-binding protein n=1 Tax=Ruminococcus gauvreauii TaxID=438033 RepID=A0ABY5VKB8_9FIRM|nr:ABC transporter ATP-binding protein [Ruminococcus gauvreauii]UWP61049.1 ABC transporter ATP-binding protein [Ruminococcus gauvreauii]
MGEIKKEQPLLQVKDLEVLYSSKEIGTCCAINGVDFKIHKGETFGLVGETGAGKTTIAMSILNLIPKPPGQIKKGEIIFNGKNLLELNRSKMRKVRGKEISMIFQDPMTALNPIDKVGDQIAEVIYLHQGVTKKESHQLAGEMMEKVGIPMERYHDFPHQFSGGMRQRIVIAMALACSPELLIADEPTTALDVTIQAQVLKMMNELKQTTGSSMLLITHDLGVVAAMCDKVGVIYAGQMQEYGNVEHIFDETGHPYTQGLFDSLPAANGTNTRLKPIKGLMPDPTNLPEGCKFHPRCEYCTERCKKEVPALYEVSKGHYVRCFRAEGKGEM